MSSHGKDSLFTSSVEKAFRILRAFGDNSAHLSLSQLARATHTTIPNAQRLTHTLVELGYLSKDPRTKRYALTLRTLDIGYRYLQTNELLERSAPYLAELNRQTEETVNVSVLDGTEVVYIARHWGIHSIGISMFIGARVPAFSTSIGQAILAFLPRDEARRILKASQRRRFTRNTIIDIDVLEKKLDRCRIAGFVVEDQEMFLGGISIAAPIFNVEGRPVASINVAVPASRYTATEVQRRFSQVLIEASRHISGPALQREGIEPVAMRRRRTS